MLYSPAPLHIPDGFLSVILSLILWIISMLIIAVALKRVDRDLDERRLPLMGVLAAAIFAVQMLNFTVIGGTSGHLMGAAISAILLGPWPAVLVMTTVISVQALIFQDGGLLVLGANIFNMAVVGVFVAHFVYRTFITLFRSRTKRNFLGGFAAAWLSIVVASLGVGLELALSGTSPANIAIPAMAGIHALIGLGEGMITVAALVLMIAARPELFDTNRTERGNEGLVWAGGLMVTLLLVVLSPLASTHPDGLQRVALSNGLLHAARDPIYEIFPNYIIPGFTNGGLATIAAGLLGVLIVVAVSLAALMIRRARRSPS